MFCGEDGKVKIFLQIHIWADPCLVSALTALLISLELGHTFLLLRLRGERADSGFSTIKIWAIVRTNDSKNLDVGVVLSPEPPELWEQPLLCLPC